MISRIFVHQWQRKVVAILIAIVVWFTVNASISTTKVIPNVPIRVINLAPSKTIIGLLPNGLLTRRITLTLTGNKEVLDSIGPGDLEVIIDASDKTEDWIPKIGRKHIVSTNPEIDLFHNVTKVSHSDFFIKLSKLVTAKIPITIIPPIGEPPKGYQFLDVWPNKLYHAISGPEEQVEELRAKGLDLIFDLNAITAAELDELGQSQEDLQTDEISYYVPSRWKQVTIPFLNNELQEINDPDAQHLRIDFLKNDLLPIDKELPIRVFYPLKHTNVLNPTNSSLATNNILTPVNGVSTLAIPLFVRDVSRLFLEVVTDNIEISIIAEPSDEGDGLRWSVQFIDPHKLEEEYVRWLMPSHSSNTAGRERPSQRESYLRHRFRDYMQKFRLYKSSHHPLQLEAKLRGKTIKVRDITDQKN